MKLDNIYQDVVNGRASDVEAGVKAALAAEVSPELILNKALIAAMDDVGQRFEKGDFFVPEMLISARAMQTGLAQLKPHLAETGTKSAGRVAIGTVKGDLHDIGKNLVCMMLEGAGFEVEDLGTDVDKLKFVDAAKNGAQVIGLSALLTTTMNSMQDIIKAINEIDLPEEVKFIIGGAPVTEDFAKDIGADAFAPDASSAVRIIRDLIE